MLDPDLQPELEVKSHERLGGVAPERRCLGHQQDAIQGDTVAMQDASVVL